MSFEKSKFGYNGGASTADSYGVSNHFGQRDIGKGQGTTRTAGFTNELVMDIDGDSAANGFPLLAPYIPAGAIVKEAFVEVTEAFVLGGTSPTIAVGTLTSEDTNGIEITEAQAEAVGTYDVTSALAGTWAAGLAAATSVGVALGGTSPTVTDAGKLRLTVRYVKM